MMEQKAEEFKILPQSRRQSKHAKELETLSVGGWYLAEGVTLKYCLTLAYRASKRLGRQFRCRTDDSGIRIYRTL